MTKSDDHLGALPAILGRMLVKLAPGDDATGVSAFKEYVEAILAAITNPAYRVSGLQEGFAKHAFAAFFLRVAKPVLLDKKGDTMFSVRRAAVCSLRALACAWTHAGAMHFLVGCVNAAHRRQPGGERARIQPGPRAAHSARRAPELG